MTKKYALLLLLLCVAIPQAQAEDFWHDSVRACVVGGGVVGASSALLLYSAAAAATAGTAAAMLPAGTIVVGNTIFGCGLGTIGTMFVYGLGSLYQGMVSKEPLNGQIPEPVTEQH
jgi:hypothetical protein